MWDLSSFEIGTNMFHENELLSEYGRQCRQRKAFWDSLGIPRKQRTKFVRWLEENTEATCSKFVEDNLDTDPGILINLYSEYKKEKENMASFDIKSNSNFIDVPGWVVQGKFVNPPPTVTYLENRLSNVDWGFANKEEETMDNTYEQRRYLENRLSNVYNTHHVALKDHFHINRQEPKTLREAAEMLKNGKFQIDAKYLDRMDEDFGEEYPFDAFSVRHAISFDLTPPDKDGFKAADKLLGKAYTDAKDVIKVAPVEEGLKALKDFESKTFH